MMMNSKMRKERMGKEKKRDKVDKESKRRADKDQGKTNCIKSFQLISYHSLLNF